MLNAAKQAPLKGTRREKDFKPVVRLHLPFTYCVWLLTELEDDGMAFGYCQITDGELGSVWLPELMEVQSRGLRVVQDLDFKPVMTLSEYAALARRCGGLLP